MSEGLTRLAEIHGIEPAYISETGETCIISDETKRRLLGAMLRVGEAEILALETHAEVAPPSILPQSQPDARDCFLPSWLANARVWGVTVQLYSVRSERNHGIGDFEDLARLAEMAAESGADFIGLNPLHVLFWTDPDRCSPYSPSTRRFLNPLYIALDRLVVGDQILTDLDLQALKQLRDAPLVDHAGVASLKRGVLERVFEQHGPERDPAFVAFQDAEGEDLFQFALFEAVGDEMARLGFASGWHGWPAEFRDRKSPSVQQFADEHSREIVWHQWLQWIAVRQLAAAQQRALSAGMRIGLYLDLAVGVAPDGAATWSDPDLVTPEAKVGTPPDMFNEVGQDWGLAPMTPSTLIARDLEPFRRDVAAAMRAAGAIRIDHAMGLQRLYWIPQGLDARGGGYVRYPLAQMLASLAELSHRHQAIVIGEDLGTLPPGFRELMRQRRLLSYRIFYFERQLDGSFVLPHAFPREAFACLATHDLPTLRGWWCCSDVAARKALGFASDAFADDAYQERARSRRQLLDILATSHQHEVPKDLPDDVFIALHVHMARTPCMLFGVQLEDVSGAIDQVNLPGTHLEHPNWQRKLSLSLEELRSFPLFSQTIAAVSRERPKPKASP